MQSRRSLLLSAGALLTLGACATRVELPVVAGAPPPPPAPPPPTASQQLDALLEKMFQARLDRSPQTVTQLGLDKTGPRVQAKWKLDDVSATASAARKAELSGEVAALRAIDRSALSGAAAVNHDAVLYMAELGDEAARRFFYTEGEGFGGPYVISQLTGSYRAIPDFLGTQHRIETKDDADAYLSRLSDYAVGMDAEAERARADIARGVIPPDFAIDRALTQMKGLIGPPSASPLVTSVANRAREKGVAGDYAGQASRIYVDKVVPALQRQIALMNEIRPRAVHDAGVWRLPDGEAYYANRLNYATTTRLTADEIHEMGLDQARQLSARADVLLKKAGYSKGTVAARISALGKDKRQLYANTDAAKEQLIRDLNAQVAAMQPRLKDYFGALPKAAVEIRRVPKFIEAGAPGGYYNTPTLDGSRPGIYWINLRDSAENPRWTLPTLTYHESIPGHHNQLALQQEADLPMIRRATFLSAYGEGWALYAEQLAQEMGVYADDPLAEIGYIQSGLFRSARLVVDTGLHHKRWSREKAIETMTSIDGSVPSAAATEIERYCVWPGQACSYMVGKLTWVRLREKARAALGPKFDIRQFHDAGLLGGAMPLAVLEGVIDSYIARARA